jgi:hypothetical protein
MVANPTVVVRSLGAGSVTVKVNGVVPLFPSATETLSIARLGSV